MKFLTAAGAAFGMLLAAASVAAAPSTPDLAKLWEMVQRQQAEIADLERRLAAAEATSASTRRSVTVTEERLDAATDYMEDVGTRVATSSRTATHVGGYGELHYNDLDADDSARDLDQIDFHRFVMYLSHEFDDRIRFFSEWELEHSFLQDTDDGSSVGEVEIEQAFLEMDLDENHLARAGLFLIPVGIINPTHEPPTFYGVERNDVENVIIPTTWWEGGAGVAGRYANGFSWELAAHSGLAIPTTGDDAFRVRSGRQKVAEASAADLAYTAQLRYAGIPGVELAATYQFQHDASQDSGDGLDEAQLFSAHGVLTRGPFTLKALWAEWQLDGDAVEAADADEQTGWYVEPSYRLAFGDHGLGFYGRVEDVRGGRTQDRFEQWELGLNYWPHERVVLKFDYRDREHDLDQESGRDFKGVDLGVGYQF